MMTRAEKPPSLRGARVMVVEDRYLFATELAGEIEALGGRVVGPHRTLAAAQAALAEDGADLALLDVNLDHDEDVFSLADNLDKAGVPFIFITGYDRELLPPRWRDRPWLGKPLSGRALREQLRRLRAGP